MVRTAGLIIGLALLTSACNDPTSGPLADQATTRFYQALAAKDYHGIYAATSPEFQQASSEPVFTGFLERIDRKMGPCRAPVKTANWRVNYSTSGVYRDQGYTRACANGTLTENISIVVRGGQAKMIGYHADSPLLLTD
jgi:hypothetical protein